ncbi:MAG: TonB-dependent receptor [Gammaproteobacteria bacterium]|nr:TonB-dependent receptor [Gammaproteobacteria bacterium]MYD75947.1 TonB-dependent receptor [Gammaproteobacteria bacterium]MYJ52807.1 TonB-dependent receptor [Gammaproteobacteria bacterium]
MKRLPYWALSALFAACAATPYLSLADDDNFVTIVITASRVAETADETMAPVTVIDREQIDRSGSRTVNEIISRVPGLSVTNNGGLGKESGVFLRGTASRHVLVLIDGVRIGSATLGTAPLRHIPLSVVEKIEVVRGPRSSLYGSEAIGGVIQIFTRRSANGFRPQLTVSAGSHDTHEVEAGISGRNGGNWYSVHASGIETEGFNACNGKNSSCRDSAFPNGYDPDRDGYRNRSLNLRGGVQLSERVDLSSGLTLSDSDTEFDGRSQDESESRVRTLFVKSGWSVTDSLHGSLTLSESVDQSDNFIDGSFYSRFDTTRRQASWLNEWGLGNHRVVSGIDFIRDQVDGVIRRFGGTTNYNVKERDNTGYFASLRSTLDPVDLEASVRLDENEQYGNKTTGGLAFGTDFSAGWRLIVSYGTAFKAPTFNDLYWPGWESPNLRPEESKSGDVGLSFKGKNSEVSINVYRTKIENLIAWAPIEPGGPWAPSNVDRAKISGVEIGFQTTFENLDLSGSLTFQEPLNDSGGNQGKLLRRRPKTLGFVEVSQDFDPWTTSLILRYQGKSYDDAANRTPVNGFGLVDVRLARALGQDWSVEFKLNNLFDKEYETVRGYNQDGRNFLLTLRYAPR